MPIVAEMIQLFEGLFPPALSEDWDNTGLLLGDRFREVGTLMTCLTLTQEVADEAIANEAQLIVTHHPIMFRPVQRLTSETAEGRLVLSLLEEGIAVYSPHTSYDSANNGINDQLAQDFGLEGVTHLRKITSPESGETLGGNGRCGSLEEPTTLREFVDMVKQRLGVAHAHFVGPPGEKIERVAIACGAAAEYLADAQKHGCQVLLTGEARFHACLEARARGMALVLPGHYATERPAMIRLAEHLSEAFPNLKVWASESESDPVQWA